jgi:hypothetical protein
MYRTRFFFQKIQKKNKLIWMRALASSWLAWCATAAGMACHFTKSFGGGRGMRTMAFGVGSNSTLIVGLDGGGAQKNLAVLEARAAWGNIIEYI